MLRTKGEKDPWRSQFGIDVASIMLPAHASTAFHGKASIGYKEKGSTHSCQQMDWIQWQGFSVYPMEALPWKAVGGMSR